MDNKRKRTSPDDGDRVEKKLKQSIVTEDANGTSSSKMTDCEIILLMMPNALPNCTEIPERNPRVHRARTGESVRGEFSGNRTEIIVWDCNDAAIAHLPGNEAAPTTTINSILPDDEISDGDTTSIEDSMSLIATPLAMTSIRQQQHHIFAHPVLDNHNLDVIENDDVNSYYLTENDEEMDETRLETISEESIRSIPERITIRRPQQQFSEFDNHVFNFIDLTLEDDDDTNSYYSIEDDDGTDSYYSIEDDDE